MKLDSEINIVFMCMQYKSLEKELMLKFKMISISLFCFYESLYDLWVRTYIHIQPGDSNKTNRDLGRDRDELHLCSKDFRKGCFRIICPWIYLMVITDSALLGPNPNSILSSDPALHTVHWELFPILWELSLKFQHEASLPCKRQTDV